MAMRKGKRGRRRLSSGSLPVIGGGVGWTTEPGEYEVAHDLFSDVGGLRVISWSIEGEGEEYVNQSILNIRNELSSALKRLPEGCASAANIRSMRAACNTYLQATPGPQGFQGLRPHFQQALWRWRQTVYEDVRAIAYGLDLDDAHRLISEMRDSFGYPAG
jgi:hypothetical protein